MTETDQIEILPCIKCNSFQWVFAGNGVRKKSLIKCLCGHRGPEISDLDDQGKIKTPDQRRREAVEAWNEEPRIEREESCQTNG